MSSETETITESPHLRGTRWSRTTLPCSITLSLGILHYHSLPSFYRGPQISCSDEIRCTPWNSQERSAKEGMLRLNQTRCATFIKFHLFSDHNSRSGFSPVKFYLIYSPIASEHSWRSAPLLHHDQTAEHLVDWWRRDVNESRVNTPDSLKILGSVIPRCYTREQYFTEFRG